MARNPRHPALYEVLNRSRFKDAQQKALERIGVVKEPVSPAPIPAEQVKVEAGQAEIVKPVETSEVKPVELKHQSVWTGRPKPVRIYPDRIELCFSWQVAGISVLALVAMFLVFFRFGQIYSTKKSDVKNISPARTAVENIKPQAKMPDAVSRTAVESKPPKMVEPMGENAIVITSYALSSHLEPVKQYFAQYGIATEIIKRGSRYLLVTQNRFDNIEKSGTEGYEMKKKIMAVGANYKPPAGSGFESFGTKPFQDIYGMKVN